MYYLSSSNYLDKGVTIKPEAAFTLNTKCNAESNLIFAKDCDSKDIVLLLKINCNDLSDKECAVLEAKNHILINEDNKKFINFGSGTIKKYVEPFVGGGAVLIDILQKYDVEEAYAFDINKDLINCYNVIKQNVETLIEKLNEKEKEFLNIELENRQEYFYKIRSEYNSYKIEDNLDVKRASEFIFLNRTCFNGLYRVNKNGKFNVPCGKYKNPTICDAKNLRNLSKLLQNVVFEYGDYKKCIKYIDTNTFVYFDPPYRPLSITSGFTSYTKEDFNDENQKELADFYKK